MNRLAVEFQSTHPVRGATQLTVKEGAAISFQSTHPVRGATPTRSEMRSSTVFQSTHPVRGATMVVMLPSALVPDFNPRTP